MKKLDKTAEHFRKQRDETLIEISKMYTKKDLCEFAEWCSKNGWQIRQFETMWSKETDSGYFNYKTSSQLREIWEVETGRREP